MYVQSRTIHHRMKKYSLIISLLIILVSFGYSQPVCHETVTLPADTKLGGGDTQGSVLIGDTYGAGQGPGIYIVADGGYRLYLNGELLAYDDVAGRARFIPMTFLPMTNAISVLGINGEAAPGIMVHIDELHQSFGTDGSWRSKTSNYLADNAWKNRTFDVSQWGGATIQHGGSLTQTPSGVPLFGASFPSGSSAKWIWSGSTSDVSGVFRFTFDLKPQGFGAGTTGGDGGAIVVVDNIDDFIAQNLAPGKKIILLKEGTYDFREFKTTKTCYVPCNATINAYKGDYVDLGNNCPGTVRDIQSWARLIWVGKDKSYIGMGRGASLRGASFYCNNGQSNMIFRNLKVWDINPHIIEAGDGISVNGAPKVWVDHCTFKWISDGNDVSGSDGQTWSWNYVQGDNEFMCSKSDNYAAAVDNSKLTYDHVYWENCQGRNPDAAGGNLVHIINNYHNVNKYYAVGGLNYSEILVEGSVFDQVSQPLIVADNARLHQKNNQFNNCGPFKKDTRDVSDLKDAVFTPPYAYTLENLSTVAASVKNGAGAGGRWRTLPLYTDIAGLSGAMPVISVSEPTNGSSFNNPSSMTITANTSASVSSVEFYNGTVKLGEDQSPPFSYSLSSFTSCTYSIVAVATDHSGNKTMSWPVSVTVSAKPVDCAGVEYGTATLDDCGRCVGGATGNTACTSVVEAEDEACSFDGILESKNAGYIGTGYINVENEVGSEITFYINSTSAGAKTLSFRFANGGVGDRPATIYVNDVAWATDLSFPSTGAFTTYKTVDVSLALDAGTNIVQLVSATEDGLANIDQIGYVSEGLSKGDCEEIITNMTKSDEIQAIELYPNPSKSSFHIRTSVPSDIEITNVEGKILKTYSHVSELEFGDDLKPGVYFARIRNQAYKFVKY